jgi:hypothetical protein
MSPLRWLWLGLAAWGAVHPWLWFMRWFHENDGGLSGMIAAWHANAATSGLTWDLTVAAVALTCFVLAETWVRKNWSALLAIPATFLIGVGCGLPLYFFLRAKPVR